MARPSSSSSSSFTYHVYLSFKDYDDPKSSLASQLYKALVEAYILPDKKTPQQGNEDIDKSRIVIVLLSTSYASSSFCLDKLVYIIDRFKSTGNLVLPVFCDMKRSDVEEFQGVPLEGPLVTGEKVQKWRKALKEAANLPGFLHKQRDGNEHTIKRIVEAVSTRIHPPPAPSFPMAFDSQGREVYPLLDVGSNDGVLMNSQSVSPSSKSDGGFSQTSEMGDQADGEIVDTVSRAAPETDDPANPLLPPPPSNTGVSPVASEMGDPPSLNRTGVSRADSERDDQVEPLLPTPLRPTGVLPAASEIEMSHPAANPPLPPPRRRTRVSSAASETGDPANARLPPSPNRTGVSPTSRWCFPFGFLKRGDEGLPVSTGIQPSRVPKMWQWKLVGTLSGAVGLSCNALSPSFTSFIGGWNKPYKIVLNCIFGVLVAVTIWFGKRIVELESLRQLCHRLRLHYLKSFLIYGVLLGTSFYSMGYDEAVKDEKPEIYSLVANACFALLSLCLSRLIKCGYEIGMFVYFLNCFTIQLLSIHRWLVFVSIIIGIPLVAVHEHIILDVPPEEREEQTA